MPTIYTYAPDVSIASGWSKRYNYKEGISLTAEQSLAMVQPTTQLTLACVALEVNNNFFKNAILDAGWEEIGWYPSCHGLYAETYGVYVYARILPSAPLANSGNSNVLTGLGCSVMCEQTKRPRLRSVREYGYSFDQNIFSIHRWFHSYGRPVEAFRRLGYRKFATTTLASYWCWGLRPGEPR